MYGAPGNRKYQASFVGYFPADNPLYTCIVVVYNPGKGTYYGGLIAGPVFKEIAEKVYSSSLDFMQPINTRQDMLTKAPASIKTKTNEMLAISKALKLPVKTDASEEAYVSRNTNDSSKVVLQGTNLESQLKKGIVPNLNGLSAKDALFLLENSGFHVKLMGIGSVSYTHLCLFALAILYKICVIQFMEGDEWKRKAEAFNTRVFEIEAVRGNIFDANGNLLATSLPYYEVDVYKRQLIQYGKRKQAQKHVHQVGP